MTSPITHPAAAHSARCCVLQIGGFRPVGDAAAVCTGAALLPPDMPWPADAQGQPLPLLAQINLSSAPWRPDALQSTALLQCFLSEEDPSQWRVLEWASLAALQLQDDPTLATAKRQRHTEARWLPAQDDTLDAHNNTTLVGTKLGGWPWWIHAQGEFEFAPHTGTQYEYQLQIDHTGASAMVYLSLNPQERSWRLSLTRY